MRIAGCEKIQQWGFDETTLDGQEVINQWTMLVDEGGGTAIVTLECAGALPCSLAENVVEHINTVWERGKHQQYPNLTLTCPSNRKPYAFRKSSC